MQGRFRRFLSYYKPYRRVFWLDMACALVAAAAALALPLCVRHITNDILGAGLPDAAGRILRTGLVMLGLIALYTLCYQYVDYQGHLMGARMERDLRRELFAHYLRQPFSFYDGHRVGELMSRLGNDTLSLAELFHHGPEDIVLGGMRLVGAFAILMGINTRLTLIVFAFLPVMAAYTVIFSRRLHRSMDADKRRIAEVNAQVEDSLSGIRVAQAFANEAAELARFDAADDAFLQSRASTYRNEAYFYQGMQVFVYLLTAAVAVLGGLMITGEALSLADLLTYTLYIGSLTGPIQGLTSLTRNFQAGITGFHRVMDVLETAPAIVDAPDAIVPGAVRGEVAFDAVSFRYGPEHTPVLRDLTLHVAAGETVAIVGHSGVGKTTLCSLVPRFYDVCGGAVRLDGADVRGIALAALRGAIGVVEQDCFLFAGTVAENIRYGNGGATDAQVRRAAELAGAADFIHALPQGYETQVGQRGVKLSGGQRQRVSIARAFLKDPAVLIFDEATSALDSESEQAVRAAMRRLARSRTTFIIAHRLSTIQHADKIAVLAEGAIAELGTHEALLARGGVYASLYRQMTE